MDCVLWATGKAKTCTRKDDGGEDPIETDEEQSFFEDGMLQKRKRRNYALCLDEGADDTSDQSAKAKPYKTARQSLRVSKIFAANQATSWISSKTS